MSVAILKTDEYIFLCLKLSHSFLAQFLIFTSSGLQDMNPRAKLQFLESFTLINISGMSLQGIFAIICLVFYSGEIMFSVLLY